MPEKAEPRRAAIVKEDGEVIVVLSNYEHAKEIARRVNVSGGHVRLRAVSLEAPEPKGAA